MTLPRPLAAAVSLLREAGRDWIDDEAPRLGAALAYYTVFSLAPLLVVVIGVLGLVLGQDAARGRLIDDVGGLVGPEAGRQIEEMIASARHTGRGLTGTLLGLATLLLGASGVFGELQAALNRVWEVEPAPSGGLAATIRRRFFSITMVAGFPTSASRGATCGWGRRSPRCCSSSARRRSASTWRTRASPRASAPPDP